VHVCFHVAHALLHIRKLLSAYHVMRTPVFGQITVLARLLPKTLENLIRRQILHSCNRLPQRRAVVGVREQCIAQAVAALVGGDNGIQVTAVASLWEVSLFFYLSSSDSSPFISPYLSVLSLLFFLSLSLSLSRLLSLPHPGITGVSRSLSLSFSLYPYLPHGLSS
jgi:hypothetical protein